MRRSLPAFSAQSAQIAKSISKSDRSSIASINVSSMISMPSFAPSASKSHDKGAKREQNPPYSHYNGLIRCALAKFCYLKITPVREAGVRSGLLSMFLLSLVTTAAAPQTHLDELIAHAKSLELDTPYVPPPGDPLVHHTAGYAKVMCTAVFITGLAPDFAAENVGYFTAPYAVRAKLGKPVIDRTNKAVHVTLPNGITRT